jgi:predicted O-methyltransferase YrrM
MSGWGTRLSRAWQAAATAGGWARHGFYIPHRYASGVTPPAAYPALLPLFQRAEPDFRALLAQAAALKPALLAIGADTPPQPRWTQDWFPRLDAVMAYTILRTRAPQRVIEVGSGHSTRFMARAIADGGLPTRLTAIDPAPRATLDGLAIDFQRMTVQSAPASSFDTLAAGDVLFIDSSHILMPGSDVDLLINGIMPRLPAGALVHFHDIALPEAYPEQWWWRGYNEQNAVAALLAGGYRILWASRYVFQAMRSDIDAAGLDALPLMPGAVECSLWLVKL